MIRPKLVFSSRVFGTDTEKILSYAKAQGYGGVEWYLNTFRLRTPQTRRDAFFRSLTSIPTCITPSICPRPMWSWPTATPLSRSIPALHAALHRVPGSWLRAE